MTQPVFIIATQRSGTNFLRSLLRNTKVFTDFDEVLHSKVDYSPKSQKDYFDWSKFSYFIFRASKFISNPRLSIPTEENITTLFDEYLDFLASQEPSRPFYLLDIKYNSLHHFDPIWQSLISPKYIFELMEERKFRVIHIVRENILDVYLSRIISNLTGNFVATESQEQPVQKIDIDVSDMLWNIQRIEREINLVRQDLESISNSIEISYDSLKSTSNKMPDDMAEIFCDFFSLNLNFGQASEFKKIIGDRWSLIRNANEVREALIKSPYREFVR